MATLILQDFPAVGRAVAGDAAAVQRGHHQEGQEDGGRGSAAEQEPDPLGGGEEAAGARQVQHCLQAPTLRL